MLNIPLVIKNWLHSVLYFLGLNKLPLTHWCKPIGTQLGQNHFLLFSRSWRQAKTSRWNKQRVILKKQGKLIFSGCFVCFEMGLVFSGNDLWVMMNKMTKRLKIVWKSTRPIPVCMGYMPIDSLKFVLLLKLDLPLWQRWRERNWYR